MKKKGAHKKSVTSSHWTKIIFLLVLINMVILTAYLIMAANSTPLVSQANLTTSSR